MCGSGRPDRYVCRGVKDVCVCVCVSANRHDKY